MYEKSLSIELDKIGIAHQTQSPIKVHYEQQVVGKVTCDVLVEERLIWELKSVTQLAVADEVQLVNYLSSLPGFSFTDFL